MPRFFILDKFNTWYDWGLVLTGKDTTPPLPKENYVTIDGMSGSLDLSESLTGEVAYQDRTVAASFWTCNGTRAERETLLRQIRAALHGKKIRLISPDDPEHYFYGRVKIKSQSNILPYAEFTIEATCEPWRYAINETTRQIDVNDETVHVVINNDGVKTVCPDITVSGSVTITYKGASAELSDGAYKLPDIKLRQGVNLVSVSGNGSVIFTYREADL